MKFLLFIIMLIMLSSCAKFPEEEIKRVKLEIENLYYQDLPEYLPHDWEQIRSIWIALDEVEKERDRLNAQRLVLYANYKIELIIQKLDAKKKEIEEKRQRVLEKIREAERLREEEIAKKKEETIQEIIQPTEPVREEKKKKKSRTFDDIRFKLEKRYPTFYTVKEGESLEDIAAYPFIYNDSAYWPLIYKYNRNQIRDPRRLYPGQILKIPRNITLDEIYKARQEAGIKNFKALPKNAFTYEKYKFLTEELLSEE